MGWPLPSPSLPQESNNSLSDRTGSRLSPPVPPPSHRNLIIPLATELEVGCPLPSPSLPQESNNSLSDRTGSRLSPPFPPPSHRNLIIPLETGQEVGCPLPSPSLPQESNNSLSDRTIEMGWPSSGFCQLRKKTVEDFLGKRKLFWGALLGTKGQRD